MTPTSRAARCQGARDEQVWKCARRLSRNIRTAALDVEDLYQVGQVAMLEGRGDFVYEAMIDELRRMQTRLKSVAERNARFLSVDRVRELAQQGSDEGRAWGGTRVLEIERAMGSVIQPDFIVALDQALVKLHPTWRYVLEQQLHGLSALEIGALVGKSKNWVDHCSFQVRKKLLKELLP